MIIEELYCDACGKLVDRNNIYELRNFKTLTHFTLYKDKKYLTSGSVCKKCSKQLERRIKKAFKEVGFPIEWKEEEA